MGRHHRPPSRATVAAIALAAVSTATCAGTALLVAPDGRAAVTAQPLPTPREPEPVAHGGPIGPVATMSIGAGDVWDEDKGPVIVDSRPLPRAPARTTAHTTIPAAPASTTVPPPPPEPVVPPPLEPVQAAQPPPEPPQDPTLEPPAEPPAEPPPAPDPPPAADDPIVIDLPDPEPTP